MSQESTQSTSSEGRSSLIARMFRREDPATYLRKDAHLNRVLRVRDFLALGVGTIVSASIFTLPGQVAALHTGPAVALSYIFAAVVAGLVAFSYAEMASVMPFAGSAYSWINVVFGEVWGWIAGWALLAEYLLAVAFVASGLSSNLQGLLGTVGFSLPTNLANPMGATGGFVDLFAVLAIIIVFALLSRGVSAAARVQNVLVVLKIIAIVLFIVVGATALHPENYVPFIPDYTVNADGSAFGGWQGIYAGVSMIFLAYIGFDSIAANSAEAKDPQRTMPRGILGSLLIAVVLFVAVSLVLVGMNHYSVYGGTSAEPIGFALRNAGHPVIAVVVQIIAVVGMFTALIGMLLAGSRLLYSFGRDRLLPAWLGHLNERHLPNRALLVISAITIAVGAFFPFAFLSQLVSAGTLIAFVFVSLGVYALRRREGRDLPTASFKVPWYPVLPALGAIASAFVFVGLNVDAQIVAGIWFVIGLVLYLTYGVWHSRAGRAESAPEPDREVRASDE